MMRSHHLVFAWALAASAGAIGSARLPAGAAAPAPAATAAPATPAPFGQLKWREVGPALAGGRTTAVVGSARNPFLYYLGTAAGGVWKSGNGGATWSPVFDKQSVASIGALALDPNNDEVVWAGTGETNPRNDVTYGGGVYKSADGGKTWTDMGLDDTLQISSIVVDPRDSNVVVVGALGDFFADSQARGIYRTTDGGKTWTKTLYVGPRSGVSDVAADPRNPSVLYAGVWQFRRMPWTFESGGPDDGLYKSTDGGATWSKLAGSGLPAPPMGRIGLAVAPNNSKRVYALIESAEGVLWRSDDAGATWSLVSKDTLADQRPFYFTHLRVDPANADHVYAVSEMLSQSKDGGRTFKDAADGVHVDFHAMWIAPNDPKRMIAGEDGGYALSVDGGEHWSFSANLAIGQVYHVGYDDRTPYSVCAPLQDNNAYCGPSNSLDGSGITNAAWQRVTGGDGVWAWPDPADANVVWVDSQDGNLSVFDRTTLRRTSVTPYEGLSIEGFDPSKARYRFNWNSPIAFSPWDPGTTWFGGNVVFQTRDRGRTWTTISPDLTKNDKAHQQPSGGPITHDVSGAEYTDTILDIEPSPLRRGEIWAGTDDGVVQVTRDGGAHWRDVTPPSAPDGRFENVAPSPLVAGTAYAVDDRHLVGDRAPHAYVTHDWGATWQAIDAGLPADQPARSIRPDARDPHLVYAGLERSMWASWDGGAHWRSLQLNLPPVPVYDIRVQPRWNDVLDCDTRPRALDPRLRRLAAGRGRGAGRRPRPLRAASRLRVLPALERRGRLHELRREESARGGDRRLLSGRARKGGAVRPDPRCDGEGRANRRRDAQSPWQGRAVRHERRGHQPLRVGPAHRRPRPLDGRGARGISRPEDRARRRPRHVFRTAEAGRAHDEPALRSAPGPAAALHAGRTRRGARVLCTRTGAVLERQPRAQPGGRRNRVGDARTLVVSAAARRPVGQAAGGARRRARRSLRPDRRLPQR